MLAVSPAESYNDGAVAQEGDRFQKLAQFIDSHGNVSLEASEEEGLHGFVEKGQNWIMAEYPTQSLQHLCRNVSRLHIDSSTECLEIVARLATQTADCPLDAANIPRVKIQRTIPLRPLVSVMIVVVTEAAHLVVKRFIVALRSGK